MTVFDELDFEYIEVDEHRLDIVEQTLLGSIRVKYYTYNDIKIPNYCQCTSQNIVDILNKKVCNVLKETWLNIRFAALQ